MKLKPTLLIAISVAALGWNSVNAQTALEDLSVPEIPPSPTLTNMGQFSQSPIDMYTGSRVQR